MTRSHIRRNVRRMSILAIIFCAAPIGLIPLSRAADPQPGGALSISPGDTSFWAKLRGPVDPSREVELPAPLGEIVADVLVEEMQFVRAGDVLVQMDDSLQRSAVSVKEIEVKYAQAQFDEAEQIWKDTSDVATRGSAQEFEVRRRKLEMDTRRMGVGVAQEQLNAEQVKLDHYQIKAPFDGEILRIDAEKGARLSQGDVALTMVSRDPLEAKLDLPVALMNELEVGRDYVFTAGEPVNGQISGKLKTLDRNINFASRTFRCVFTIENPALKLPSGFEVRLTWPQP